MSSPSGNTKTPKENTKKNIQIKESLDTFIEKYNILDEVPVGIYFNDLSGTILYGNKKAEQITGLDRKKIFGTNIRQLTIIDANSITKALKMLAMLGMGKASGPETFKIKKNDGSEATVEITAYPVKISGKTISMNIINDITERNYIQSELKKSEELYRSLTESMSDMVYLIDDKNCVLFVNSAAEKGFNAKRGELICRSVDTLFPQEITKFHKASVNQAFKTGQPAYSEIHEKIADSDRWFESRLSPVKDQSGKVISVMGIAHDITKRKMAEEELKKREELYRSLTESISDRIYLIDKNRCVTFVNSSASKDSKIKKYENICIDINLIFPSETAKLLKIFIDDVFANGNPVYKESKDVYENSERYLDIRISPVKDENGDVKSVILITHDITDKKKIAEALKESEKTFRDLVENALIGVYKTNISGEVIYANGALLKMLGFDSLDDMKKQGALSRYANKADRDILIEKLKNNGKVENFETNFLSRSGNIIPVFMSATTDGNFILGMIMDVTELKNAGEKLEKLNQDLNEKLEDLERFNKLAVGRELKMVELKKKIAELEAKVKK